jgi:drug/metabolite transporter (DMT)-like permease
MQLGPVPADVSVFWRFLLAAIAIWGWLGATGRLRRAARRQHLWFAALGATLFSGNFLFLYGAEGYVPSGTVSVVFSLATVFNAFNQWLFLGVRPTQQVLIGAALGAVGIVLLFSDQIFAPGLHSGAALGFALALGGTYCFSLGNLISRRATRDGTSLPNAVARGMSWGVVYLGLVVALHRQSFVPRGTVPYMSALLYLALIGSVFGFLAYLSLVARIGPERAAYVTILSPVIALGLSTMLEGYNWNVSMILGLPMILAGNFVIFFPSSRSHSKSHETTIILTHD